ncbi:MAG: sensor histidine kinase [Fusicatenibacter saccharivorans]
MANLIARIAVLLVLAAAGMVLADRKEKIDLSVSLLLFLAAVNVTSFFSLKDNRIVVVMILTVYFLLYAGAKELLRRRAEKKENECKSNIRLRAPMQSSWSDVFEFSCKFKNIRAGSRSQSDIAEELHMEGDAARIHQLVSLLVDNAVKYTPEGGKIHIFWRKNGKKAEFSVQNTCDTLPEGDLNRLFDRFYRADASRARESGGYGIGLSVAAAIVKAHKGKITAERTRDGICFKAVFPAKG